MVELHVQLGLVAVQRLPTDGVLSGKGRVCLSGAGQPQHQRAVSLGRREGDEQGGAVADTIGVGLVPHGLPHFVGARYVAAACFGVVQDLVARRSRAVGTVESVLNRCLKGELGRRRFY